MNSHIAPAKIVLTTFGSFGDVHPYLAIGRELKARGHHVVVATCELYRGAVESAGLEFFAVRPDLPDLENNADFYARVMNPLGGGAKYLLQEIVAPSVRQTFADLCEATRDADVLISHSMSVVAPLVALTSHTRQSSTRKRPLIWISAVVSPMFLQSVSDAPSLPLVPALARVPFLGEIAARSWNRWMGNWLAQPLDSLRDLRHELGLPPAVSPLFADAHSPHRVLALFSPLLAPPQTDWPPQTRAVGFCFHDRNRDENEGNSPTPANEIAAAAAHIWPPAAESLSKPLVQTVCLSGAAPLRAAASIGARGIGARKSHREFNSELQKFLEQSARPPILFTLGASSAMNAGEFWQESARAVALLKRRAIFVLGRELESASKFSSPHIFCVSYLPLSQILPCCESAVHHGGIGTIALCLQAGTPMILVPQAQDQPDNAWRAARMGAARLLPKSRYRAERVARELRALSSTRYYDRRAQFFRARIAREDGTQTACDEIEKTIANEPGA